MNDQKRKVLFVDDEPMNLVIAKITFQAYFDVVTAESAKEGLEIIHNDNGLACIVSDMSMPEMNGLQFIQTAKLERPDLCCFLLSGFHQTEEIVGAIERNEIMKYFQKPVDRQYILSSIDTCC